MNLTTKSRLKQKMANKACDCENLLIYQITFLLYHTTKEVYERI